MTTMRTPPFGQLASAGAIVAALTLAACGGSDSPSNAASERSQEQRAETKFADFAKCLREHGVNAETASAGHALKLSGGASGSAEAAQKACARYRPEPKKVNLSPQQKVELEERVQKFAKCMREHGIHVETSTAGGGIEIGIHRRAEKGGAGENGPNPESPAFQQAQTACQKLLPKPPGAGAAAGPFAAHGAKGSGNASGLALRTDGG
jgi:hypothetical protein